MKLTILNTAKTFVVAKASRAALVCKANSPVILLGVGAVTVVGGTVLACKETLKLDDILAERDARIEQIDNALEEHPELEGKYTAKDIAHDKLVVRSQTAVKIVKNYIPAAGMIALGLVCILASYKIMSKRNVALTAAYNALKGSYDAYRARVKAKYGEEEEKNLFFGIEDAQNKLESMTEEERQKAEESKDMPWWSDYAKFFDSASAYWDKSSEYNKTFLLHQQSIFNEKLNRKGHVFLNEVYDALDIPRTQAGAMVGWLKNGSGDGFIDFGIFNVNNHASRRAINGYEDVWLLDFNVDGVIYDQIGPKF